MTKKVIDIIPRKGNLKQVVPPTTRGGSEAWRRNKISPTFSSWKRPALILTVLVLIGISTYAYFALPKAEIKIWPKTEPLIAETKLIVGEEISGQVLEFEEIVSQSFPAQGKFLKEKKASGVIRVYNNYSTGPINLTKRTRFKSACGKIFHTPVAISIPGKRRDGGNWVPGWLDVEVIASKPGNEFNIEPTAFSVPGLRGTALFTTVTGRSYQMMTGGKIKYVGKVTQEDLNLAEEILREKAINRCLDKLRNYQGFYIPEKLINIDILEATADVEVGTKVKEFNFQAKARCRTIGFKEEDVEKFVLDYLNKEIIEEKLIVPGSLEIDYSLKNIDIDQGEMTLYLNLTAKTYLAIDKVTIKKQAVGRSLSSVKEALEGWSGISRIDIDFWPFWVESVPENLDRIELKLKFDPVRSLQ